MSIKLKQKTTLKEALKQNPHLNEEIQELISKTIAEERYWIKEEFKQLVDTNGIQSNGQDRHYGLYESLATPIKVSFDKNYINSPPQKELQEAKKENKKLAVTVISLDGDDKLDGILKQESITLKLLYESFSGGDAITNIQDQAGVPLKKRQNEAELRIVQLITNSRYNQDPYLRNMADSISRYIIGIDIKISVGEEQIENILTDFVDTQDIINKTRDVVKTSFKDGETGFHVRCNVKKSKVKGTKLDWDIFKVFSEEIRGFEIQRDNPGHKYSYYKAYIAVDGYYLEPVDTWYADIEYFTQFNTRGNLISNYGLKSAKHSELDDNNVILWYQHGDKRELRGRVPFEPILRDLRLFEDFRISRAILNYERSKVLYLKKVKQMLNKKGSTTTDRKSPSPKGGVQLTIGPNEDYDMISASLHAGDAETDGLLFLYSASSGMSVPIYISGMRADQQNYSAIKNTDSPFGQMILEYAGDFSTFLEKLLRYVVRKNVEYKILPDKVKMQVVSKESKLQEKYWAALEKAYKFIVEGKTVTNADISGITSDMQQSMQEIEIDTINVPIQITIADAVKPNPLELAKTAFIQRKIGMVSSRTLSERAGFIWAQELIRMLEEKALGIYVPDTGAGNANSSNASGGTSAGSNVDDGSGTMNQNVK